MKCLLAALWLGLTTAVHGQSATPPANAGTETLASALSAQQWSQVEQSIDRALSWLARQQESDGAIDAPDNAQPAATSLTIMAFLSKGHLPGEGPYGRTLEKAIDFVLRTQQADGLLAYSGGGAYRSSSGKTANYNHAIAGLMLTEVYGMTDRTRAARLYTPQPNIAETDSGRSGRVALPLFGYLWRIRFVCDRVAIDVSALGQKRGVRRPEAVHR